MFHLNLSPLVAQLSLNAYIPQQSPAMSPLYCSIGVWPAKDLHQRLLWPFGWTSEEYLRFRSSLTFLALIRVLLTMSHPLNKAVTIIFEPSEEQISFCSSQLSLSWNSGRSMVYQLQTLHLSRKPYSCPSSMCLFPLLTSLSICSM